MQEKRIRRNAEQWQTLIELQSQSGLTVQAFCEEQDLTVSSFQAWKARLRKDAGSFQKIKMSSGAPAPMISCRLPNGLRLEWQEGISPSIMLDLIRALS